MSEPTSVLTQRYWCRREGEFHLDPLGFLHNFEGSRGRSIYPDLLRLSDAENRSCLILLGEPGMGKSTELAVERHRRDNAPDPGDDVSIWGNLGEYGSEDYLIKDLFETPLWAGWRSGTQTMCLHLDGLDECRLFLPHVAQVILGRLRQIPCRERLKFRIVCRTGVWPIGLEHGLKDLWPDDQTEVLELAPLRRCDVAGFASEFGDVNVEAFFKELNRCGAGPLGAKPVTLKLLLGIFKERGALPDTQEDVYERGCRALCKESNQNRRDAGKYGALERFSSWYSAMLIGWVV